MPAAVAGPVRKIKGLAMTDTLLKRSATQKPVTDPTAATPPVQPRKFGRDAAMTATGEDIDNDHADERPVNRSQDAESETYEDADREFFPKR